MDIYCSEFSYGRNPKYMHGFETLIFGIVNDSENGPMVTVRGRVPHALRFSINGYCISLFYSTYRFRFLPRVEVTPPPLLAPEFVRVDVVSTATAVSRSGAWVVESIPATSLTSESTSNAWNQTDEKGLSAKTSPFSIISSS